ncbi:MAG: cell wall-active antibiotics response protein [Chloroflexi bacterium]|nr:cell wall-active antibiotics response protein [Chloroflexota bacterium]
MRTGRVFGALVLIGLGVLLLLGNLNIFIFRWDMLGPLFLILIGVWLVSRAFVPGWGHSSGDVFAGIGEYRPDLSGKEIRREKFSYGIGDSRVDLTRATFLDGENVVEASQGIGELRVTVPRDLALRVRASAGMGEARLFDEQDAGIDPHVEFQSQDYATATRKLNLTAHVGLGAVRVTRA